MMQLKSQGFNLGPANIFATKIYFVFALFLLENALIVLLNRPHKMLGWYLKSDDNISFL
jgi:hypothetical protein